MAIALAHALHRNRSLVYARYLQLATVRADGKPANRTVVFRGFLDPTNQLQFITDTRSQKLEQISLHPWGEACWYFPKTREQFRLLGKLKLVSADHPDPTLLKARQTIWHDLSDAARSQFVWADPGAPKIDAATFAVSPPDRLTPVPNFCLLLLDPDQVDHLELRGEPQNRFSYLRKDNLETDGTEWSVQLINP
ncbi:MAG: pyridoxamine 5'-phosphate oxidase [Leptolyngbyaceae cyanobacterium CRU_2_3]|nr:pyridoxamine 5'-phosphate oxidase [Leptolyngbyaceae cyanobacterium CRU_2_3]